MKKILVSILFFCTIKAYSQDTLRIHQIDGLVTVINRYNLKIQYDTILQNYPEIGLNMKTYLSMILEGSELKKYVSKVNTVRQENGISKQMIASSSFYFNKSELIKVEEFIIEGDKERHADWYYSNDKPLYYALPSDRSEERANFLLTLSKTFLKQIQK